MGYIYHDKGIYNCNGKNYYSKLEAILQANTSGQQISWDYHDQHFSRYDWSKEPTQSLPDLYRDRAQQLRDNYDYLVLFYSGGVDSTTILNAFVHNNIPIDEIYVFGAFRFEEAQYGKLGWDPSPGYYTREVAQALPMVKKLTQNSKVKITVYDWGQDIVEAAKDLDWIWRAGTRFDPTCMVRSRFHKIIREHNEMVHRGKRVGFVYGVDKPRLLRDNNSIYFAFLDIIMTLGAMPTNDILGEYWENDEYFYWTPNFPEIAIKQSHVLTRWLKARNRLHLIRNMNNPAQFHDDKYYYEVNRAVYQDMGWDFNTWQIQKPTNMIYSEMSQWLFDGSFETEKQKWESSLWELERQIGLKWFNNNTVNEGLRGHLSKLYKICDYDPTVDH
jgi:hypothetical protein